MRFIKKRNASFSWICISCFISIIFLTGCAASQFRNIKTTQFRTIPSKPSNKTKIYLIRDWQKAQGVLGYLIYEGESLIGLVGNGRYLVWETEKSNIEIRYTIQKKVNCFFLNRICIKGEMSFLPDPKVKTKSLILKVNKGETYYLFLELRGFFSDIAYDSDLYQINQIEAKKIIPDLDFLPPIIKTK
jgi:hypothetical protein